MTEPLQLPTQIPKGVLKHEEVIIAARPHGRGTDVLFDPRLSLACRQVLSMLTVRPVAGHSALLGLHRAAGCTKERLAVYLNELFRAELIEVEAGGEYFVYDPAAIAAAEEAARAAADAEERAAAEAIEAEERRGREAS